MAASNDNGSKEKDSFASAMPTLFSFGQSSEHACPVARLFLFGPPTQGHDDAATLSNLGLQVVIQKGVLTTQLPPATTSSSAPLA
jgi:hypothetical protein